MQTKSCCFRALFAKSILGILPSADKDLQTRNWNLPAALLLIEVTQSELLNLRSDEAFKF